MRIRFAEGNLDIHLVSPDILSEYPHFSLAVQHIHDGAFGVIIAIQLHDDFQTLAWGYPEFQQTVLIF